MVGTRDVGHVVAARNRRAQFLQGVLRGRVEVDVFANAAARLARLNRRIDPPSSGRTSTTNHHRAVMAMLARSSCTATTCDAARTRPSIARAASWRWRTVEESNLLIGSRPGSLVCNFALPTSTGPRRWSCGIGSLQSLILAMTGRKGSHRISQARSFDPRPTS